MAAGELHGPIPYTVGPMPRPVITRFAPSPTGPMHLGNVRTALFNWLFARRHGGQFLLRIDDTDQQRNLDQALKPILDGFRWLQIDWDEGPDVGGPYGPYFQSERQERYQQAVEQLITAGAAYYDYAATDEVQAERAAAVVARLRPDQRKVLKMGLLEGMTHSEIATATGMPLGTVKTQMRRGLIQVRQWMKIDGPATAGQAAS